MSKSNKAFYAKVVRRIKRELRDNWTLRQLEVCERQRSMLDAPLDVVSGNPILRGCMLTYFMDCLLREIGSDYLEEQEIDSFIYPGLIGHWEKMPRTLHLDASAVKAILGDEDYSGARVENLIRLFPSCLLIDLRPLHWEEFGAALDNVFVYPVYDDKADRVILQYVGSGPKGWGFAIESKLLLSGDTFATSRAHSDTDHNQRLLADLSGLSLDSQEFSEYYYYFNPMLDDTDFGRQIDRILAIACSNQVVLTEGIDGNVPSLLLSVAETDCKIVAPPKEPTKVDENLPAYEEAATDSIILVEEPLFEEEPEPISKLQPEKEPEELEQAGASVKSNESTEPRTAILLQEIENLQREFDDYRMQSESTQASIVHNLRNLEIQVMTLRRENVALSNRAQFAENLQIPTAPIDAFLLAEQLFSDRLILLDSARKSVKEYSGNTAEVWAVLRCAATVLHPLVFVRKTGYLSAAFQSECGYEITLRDAHHTKKSAKLAQLRQVEYNGQMRDMTAHIKGRSNKPGETLRVHFFADYDAGKIVVGHCGEHLKTFKSSSL